MKYYYLKRYAVLVLLSFLILSCETDMAGLDSGLRTGDFASLNPTHGNGNIEPGQITAGEWNDLENWSYWQGLLAKQEFSKMPNHWNFNLIQRYALELKDNNGIPSQDVSVALMADGKILWRAKTDNKGKAELWGKANWNPTQRVANSSLQ
jgi:hypothetical protein